MNNRQKSILTGFYLSKFDNIGLKTLGFESYTEAFNILGYSIGSKPASIKNYRDEFDPYFPNPRKGWHKRPLRGYCKVVMDEFANFPFDELTEIVKGLFVEDYQIKNFIKNIIHAKEDDSFSKRLITGKAAEEYFRATYNTIPQFAEHSITETTHLGCGFDFKLSLNLDYYCIEVKGLDGLKGSIALTEKEYDVAGKLKSRFCLFIVSNFQEKPQHDLIFNPLESRLTFSKTERPLVQVTYSANFQRLS